MRCFSLLLLLAFSVSLSAQEIQGVLFDQKTQEPLISATVQIKGTTQGGITDVDGKFRFTYSQPFPFTLVISYVGYTPIEKVIRNETEAKQNIVIRLSPSEVVIKEVKVVDTRITQKQRESALTVESMGLQAIKQVAAPTFYEGLSNLKGVDMTAASLGFVVINTRGFNSTSPVRSLQLLDGADNQAPGLNFSIGNFAGATELDIQKVDLVVGASTPLYGPNAFNGVINLQTKNPFYFPGLSVMVKGAERNLFEGALRFAHVFANKKGEDKLAFKINFSYIRANDWQANNMDPSSASNRDARNFGGYDAVNRYGDELQFSDAFNYDNRYGNRVTPGLGQLFRTGYQEKDVVDYNMWNLKTNAAVHYRITKDIEARVAYNFGTGTTVYQGDNRYSLKDIKFHHLRAEIIKPDKFYIRAYTTMEDAGNSYDAVFTALKLQQLAKGNDRWQQDYVRYFKDYYDDLWALGYPQSGPGWLNYDSVMTIARNVMEQNRDLIQGWHDQARLYADTFTNNGFYPSRFIPGTAAFDSMKQVITSRTAFEEGGTRFYDKSKMFHLQGEYKFEPKLKGREKPFMDILTGASFRMYFPDSRGTVFSDTMMRTFQRDSLGAIVRDINGNAIVLDSSRRRITNWEVGVYLSLTKRLFRDRLIITATARMDKNQNFPFLFSPAVSVVWSEKNHNARISYSSAVRNPTLQDQYLFYNVGRAILIGNLNGVDSLVTVESYRDYIFSQDFNLDTLRWFNINKVRPEQVQTVEVGYKGTWWNKVFFDMSAYVSFYRYFLGYRIGIQPTDVNNLGQRSLRNVFRVASNSEDMVMTYGVSAGFNYYFIPNYSFNGNYSWNRLNRLGSTDPIIPAYNTPEHKFNVGVSGQDIRIGRTKGWGFNVNYKWIDGFTFEGSPQFTGPIPSYSLLDAQISYVMNLPKVVTTFKIGGSNLISRMNYQAYGGPAIGRMVYGQVFVELKDLFAKKKKTSGPGAQ